MNACSYWNQWVHFVCVSTCVPAHIPSYGGNTEPVTNTTPRSESEGTAVEVSLQREARAGCHGGWQAPLVKAKTNRGGCWMTRRHSFSPRGVNSVRVSRQERLPVKWHRAGSTGPALQEGDGRGETGMGMSSLQNDRHGEKYRLPVSGNYCWADMLLTIVYLWSTVVMVKKPKGAEEVRRDVASAHFSNIQQHSAHSSVRKFSNPIWLKTAVITLCWVFLPKYLLLLILCMQHAWGSS